MALPYGTGAGLSGFLNAYYQAAELRRRQQLAEDASQLHDLQLSELHRQALAREAGRAVVPQILSATPETATIRSAIPAVPSVSSLAAGVPTASGEEQLLPAYAPPSTLGRPAVTESAPTLRSLSQALGPEALGTAITTPEGQAAIKARGVISDEAFEQKKRLADARETYHDAMTASLEAFSKGQPIVGILQEIAAVRAQMAVADPAHVAALQARMSKLTEDYTKVQKDADERQRVLEDGTAFARAMKRPEIMVETVSGFQSDRFKRIGDAMMQKVAEGALDDAQYPGMSALTKRVGELWTMQTAAGQRPDSPALWSQALHESPTAMGDVMRSALAGKKLPEPILTAAFGGSKVPKTDIELAHRVVTESKGIKDTDPQYAQAMFTTVKALKEAERRPEKDTTVADLGHLVDKIDREIQLLESEQRELRGAVPKPGDVAAEALMSPVERRDVTAKRERMNAITGEIAMRRARSRQVLDQIDGLIAGRQARPPGVAGPSGTPPPAVGAPMPSPPTADQAGTELRPAVGADPKRAVPPPARPTLADAMAEKRRLISVGHTPQSAKEAMRQVGWQ